MQKENRIDVSVFQQSKLDNQPCGDSYFYQETDRSFICALADGLGSGDLARESSQAVMDIIEQYPDATNTDLIKQCNQVLSGKRGVVLGVLRVDFQQERYTFSSIGNIGLMTVNERSGKKRNIPNPGYLSTCARPIKTVSDTLEDGLLVLMFTDGVSSKELSHHFFYNQDVKKITELYACYKKDDQFDDTTLIAMRYQHK